MNRIIYVAGVNRKHLAASAASNVPYWLLSVTLLRKYPSWLSGYITPDRRVLWDPGSFSEDPVSYSYFRSYLDRYARKQDGYFQYDEIGDPEVTAWYLSDMRRRGYDPIPILQPGGDETLLTREKMVGIGGLIKCFPNESEQMKYLDHLFYDNNVTAQCHLMGMLQHKYFAPYKRATRGDNTSWIPRDDWNRQKTIEEWMKEYGDQWIPFEPRTEVQMRLAI
jgi:hypothetical protein